MNDWELQNAVSYNNSQASYYDGEARRYTNLANSTRSELTEKQRQLERAKNAREKCLQVDSQTSTYVLDLEAFGSAVAGALDRGDVSTAISKLGVGMTGLSAEALSAADTLISTLENEVSELSTMAASYEASARSASSSASAYRRAAADAQAQLWSMG